jgi:hypothetical protein
MKRIWSVLLAALLLCLLAAPLSTVTAHAADYDEIVDYRISVVPNTEDGSLNITVDLTWKALEELPYGQELKIGVPNGSIRDEKALTDNIERLDFDNSYMYVYLDRAYGEDEVFQFSYSWVQEYMYTLSEDGRGVTYDYTPGWFDEAVVDRMELTWQDPAGVSGTLNVSADHSSRWTTSGRTLVGENLPHGSQIHVTAAYPDWPAQLSWDGSSENLPDDMGYYDGGDNVAAFATMVITVVVILVILMLIIRSFSRDGYAGGFGTHYVFLNGLWYPAGPDGHPRPGSVGTHTKPRPPHSSGFGGGGFGGGHRPGGFGGGGFGGGSHCACASSCACACACACAGGGRAGCSAKNLYGAVKLDAALSEQLDA